MPLPTISIITPTFNASESLEHSIKSVIAQTYPNIEYIIIDGASTDDTWAIIEKYGEYVKVKVSEPDKGVYDAMNKGIRLATGEWLYFLGADDTLFDNSVVEQVAGKLNGTQAHLVYGDVLVRGDCSWAKDNTVYDGEFSISKLFSRNICHQAIFYKRELFARLGDFNIRYPVCADWDFNHRCFGAYRTGYLNQTIAVFYAGGKSSQPHRDSYREESVFNLKKYYGLSFFSKLFGGHSEIFLMNAREFFTNGRYLKSLYFFLISMIHTRQRIFFLKRYGMTILTTIRSRAVFVSFAVIML